MIFNFRESKTQIIYYKRMFTCGLSSGKPNKGLLGTQPISDSTPAPSSPHVIYIAPPSCISKESENMENNNFVYSYVDIIIYPYKGTSL